MNSGLLISICQKKGLRYHGNRALMGKETSTKFHWKHRVQEITLGNYYFELLLEMEGKASRDLDSLKTQSSS